MESGSFQSQLLSVMEVLATAAVAEINRRVDDSCAVLRLEVSRSRRDIELLKRKCEVMEAELRRSRMRARRKVFYPPAAERFSPLVKIVLNKERQSAGWSRQDPEHQNTPQQCVSEAAEPILIKEERSEDDTWKSETEDKLISAAEQPPCFAASQPAGPDAFVELHQSAESPTEPGSLLTDVYGAQTEQPLNRSQSEAELMVKHERGEEPDENAAPLESSRGFLTEDGDGQLWSSGLCRDAGQPSFSYAGQPFEPAAPTFPPQGGCSLEDMEPMTHSEGKSHSSVANSARMKRRARMLGCRRAQPEERHDMDAAGHSVTLQHQYRDARNPDEDPLAPSFGRGSFVLARKMRTPWRSGIGEKRFSCTYCDKSFMRFSQLKEHLRSHTGEKPFSCLQCGRSFTKQCNLIRHAVVHSGEKPYECSLCGKCFTQRSSLKSHQKTAH